MSTVANKAVSCYAHFQFSGSAGGGIANFSGSGITGCYLSGTTYTLQFDDAWPNLAKIDASLALSPSYFGTVSGGLEVVFNGSQVSQLSTLYTGSSVQASSSGKSQTIDFAVLQSSNGLAVAVPYQTGSNWCFVEAVFLNQGYSKG